MDDKRYWLGFNLVRGIGAVRLRLLIEHFGNAEAAWNGSAEQLRDAGLGAKTIARLSAVRSDIDLNLLWQRAVDQDIRVVTSEDEAYPARLKEIEQPPPVLFVRGDWRPDDAVAVAVVGTRRITAYGRQVTEQLSGYLAANGITIVSGLARGVDEVAHSAALAAGGRTAAVLGSGVDRIYPPENRGLADKIMSKWCVVSDYPMGTAPESGNFPAQSHHLRTYDGHNRRGGRRVQRCPDHGGVRAEQGAMCCRAGNILAHKAGHQQAHPEEHCRC
jgi:DNA processing protein